MGLQCSDLQVLPCGSVRQGSEGAGGILRGGGYEGGLRGRAAALLRVLAGFVFRRKTSTIGRETLTIGRLGDWVTLFYSVSVVFLPFVLEMV